MKQLPSIRAWDKRNNRMVSVYWLDLNNSKACIHTQTPFCTEGCVSFGYLIFMFGIGKKDKYGNEIFDGDILATGNSDPQCDIWTEEDFGYTVVEIDDDLNLRGTKWDWTEGHNSVYDLEFIRIVGNIYENPDLLDTAKVTDEQWNKMSNVQKTKHTCEECGQHRHDVSDSEFGKYLCDPCYELALPIIRKHEKENNDAENPIGKEDWEDYSEFDEP